MGTVIGMDEAGYGPNLGPLVITATVWDVPGHPRETNFWDAFAEVVDQRAPADDKLHVADSKQVYQSTKGIGSLETSVFGLLGLLDSQPQTVKELWRQLTAAEPNDGDCGPWLIDRDLTIPRTELGERVAKIGGRWRDCCGEQGIRLRTIVSDVVTPTRFNRLLAKYDSKGVVLSKLSMLLLARVLDFDASEPVLVIADKHGGRNRYDHLLEEIAGDRFIVREIEGRAASSYRIEKAQIRFQTRAEEHLPVAAASLFCKYVRETVMELFNDFWGARIEGLKPTKGYPVDAKRFRTEISEMQRELGIADDVLWRQR